MNNQTLILDDFPFLLDIFFELLQIASCISQLIPFISQFKIQLRYKIGFCVFVLTRYGAFLEIFKSNFFTIALTIRFFPEAGVPTLD
jgi:hypothetical protein